MASLEVAQTRAEANEHSSLSHDLFTNAHLAEKTLWSEKVKLYGHGYEVYCVASFYSDKWNLIASACKVRFTPFFHSLQSSHFEFVGWLIRI